MKIASLTVLLLLTGRAVAETVGLRFIVNDSVAGNPVQQHRERQVLNAWTRTLNQYYRNSGVVLRAKIVNVTFAGIKEHRAVRVLKDMAAERNGFSGLLARAQEFGADYTIAVTNGLINRGRHMCGRAYAVNKTVAEISSVRRALLVMDSNCGAHTLAHELGHLMGLNHGSLIDRCLPGRGNVSAIAPYANGYAKGNCDGKPQPGEFGTIMVGGWMKAVNGRGKSSLPLFSSPRLRDARCGVRGVCGNARTGDAVRALNENAHYYAAHEEP